MPEESTVEEQQPASEETKSVHDLVSEQLAGDDLDEPEAVEEQAAEPEPEPEPEEVEQTEEDTEPLEAPAHWAAEDREAFSQLPPEGRQLVLERHKAMEGDYTRKTQELAEQRRIYEGVRQALGPLVNYISPDDPRFPQVLGQMSQAYMAYNQNPVGYVKALQTQLEKRGYQLQSQPGAQEDDDEFADPDLARVNQKVDRLMNTLSEQSQVQQRSQQTAQQQAAAHQQQQLLQEWGNYFESWGNEKPHFKDVRKDMGGFIQGGVVDFDPADPEPGLKAAYDMAVRARGLNTNPRDQAVRKAKRAASGTRSTGASRNLDFPADASVRDIIEKVTEGKDITLG